MSHDFYLLVFGILTFASVCATYFYNREFGADLNKWDVHAALTVLTEEDSAQGHRSDPDSEEFFELI